MFTDLYNFMTDTKTYSAVGTNVYDAIWGIITWHPEMSEVEQIEKINIATGQKEMLKPEIIKAINEDIVKRNSSPIIMKGLQNVGGYSCFMDSLLFPILIKDGYFKTKFLESEASCQDIKKSLVKIHENILSGNNLTCIPLVQTMKKCDTLKRFIGDQQDDSEFLIALMDVYDLTPTIVNNRIYLSNDRKRWKSINNSDIKQAVLEITPELNDPLKIYQQPEIEDYRDDPDNAPKDDSGKRYDFKFSADRITSSECLIIHTKRRELGKKNLTPIIISRVLKDEARDIYYNLEIITIHHGTAMGGHYTSFFRWGDQWYHYDDLKSEIKNVGWEFVKEIGGKSGSLLIYYPI